MPRSLLYSYKVNVLLNNSIYTVYQKFFLWIFQTINTTQPLLQLPLKHVQRTIRSRLKITLWFRLLGRVFFQVLEQYLSVILGRWPGGFHRGERVEPISRLGTFHTARLSPPLQGLQRLGGVTQNRKTLSPLRNDAKWKFFEGSFTALS